MRVGYISDIHLRFNGDHEGFIASLEPSVDVQVIAGDVIDDARDFDLLRAFLQRFSMPVVFVPGNHEYMRDSSPDVTERNLRSLEQELPNLHVLINSTWQAPGGPRFVGTTLWYRAFPETLWRYPHWPDFQSINDIVAFTQRRSDEDDALLSSIQEGDIVVTHMLPTWRSVDLRYQFAKNNELFVRDSEAVIRAKRPALWFHGHTHAAVDALVGETRVLCNPRGHIVTRENEQFDVRAEVTL